MNTQHFTKAMKEIAKSILHVAQEVELLQAELHDLKTPHKRAIHLGGQAHYLVRQDYSITPGFERIHAEQVRLTKEAIAKSMSRLEGLRFKLVQLIKAGAAK